MKPRAMTFLLVAGFGLAPAAVLLLPGVAFEGAAEAAPAVRSFELTYRAVIDELPENAGEVRIWLPYPEDDEAQEVEVTDVSSPYPTRIERDPDFGNSVLFVSVEDPEVNPVTIEMKARVRRIEKVRRDFPEGAEADDEPPPEAARWLEPDRLVPLDGRIRELAAEVTEGKETDLEKARAIYDYVVDTMSYDKSGTGWGRGDIYWACDMKRGNCTDFHALFTGLNRAVGIPAKFAIGFPIPPDRGRGQIGGYHCWAEFWLDGYGWVPVDTSEARKHPEKRDYFFGAHDENRVEFTEGRDLVLSPEQEGEPLNYFVYPYVEVDGKPWEKVTQTFAYEDLDEGRGSGRSGS